MEKNVVNIGLIGLGGMSNHHLGLLSRLENVQITALCDVSEKAVKTIGDKYGVAEDKRYQDYESLIKDEEVHAVISMVPNKYHADIIRASIKHQKPLMTEKPFTVNFAEAEELEVLYKENPVPIMVGFSYRYIPAFRYVKELLENKALGRIRHISFQYLQQWGSPLFDVPMSWRFNKEMSGSGALGDLGSHMIDTARYLVGEFRSISSMMTTFITERKGKDAMEVVDVDDFTSFQAQLENGVMGTFVTSRNAIGSGNQLEFTIYGDNGTIKACCEQPDEVHLCIKDKENTDESFSKVTVPDKYKLNQLQDFIEMARNQTPAYTPTFYDGYENQKIVEAIIISSLEERTVRL
jgi:predicted dehydrogenase